MDLTMLQNPAIFGLMATAIAGLIWRISRLHTKIDELGKENLRLNVELADLKAVVQAHKDNGDIHFNLRLSQQVDEKNEFRFRTIEGQLGEINRKLDKLAERE